MNVPPLDRYLGAVRLFSRGPGTLDMAFGVLPKGMNLILPVAVSFGEKKGKATCPFFLFLRIELE